MKVDNNYKKIPGQNKELEKSIFHNGLKLDRINPKVLDSDIPKLAFTCKL